MSFALAAPVLWLLPVTALAFADLVAQESGEKVISMQAVDDDALLASIQAGCAAARAAGKLVDARQLVLQTTTATGCALPVVAAATTVLSPPDLHDHLRRSCRILGHYYLCKECDEWHFNAASAFCVDGHGAVATCAHVVAPDDGMRDAFLVSADLDGRVWPVQRVLAVDSRSDLCVLQTAERDTVPLPLRAAVRTGEPVWCLSNPDHQFAFFSDGIVARQFVLREPPPETPAAAALVAGPLSRWLHVTCDFCRGSSGAPIVDARGNVVGIAQATTTVVHDEDAKLVDTQMVFKAAAPAAALASLIQAVPAAERPKDR
jgi:serine protease Do